MSMSATALANSLIEDADSDLEELQVHEFPDADAANDAAALQGLYEQFAADFDGVASELSIQYGEPTLMGDSENDAIPLAGVFRFAIWQVEDKQLYLAAAQEELGAPITLSLGTTMADDVVM